VRPETKFARSGDLHIAYRTQGKGPPDLVFVPNWIADVETWEDVPVLGRCVHRLASFARLVTFDQPGTGLSDPVGLDQLPTLEVFADSIRTVIDDLGIERAALIGWGFATQPSIMFAATYPERTSALVIQGGSARLTADGDYQGMPQEDVDEWVEADAAMRGTHERTKFAFPSMASDEQAVEAWADAVRRSLSPGMFKAAARMIMKQDVRPLVPLVTCPTLVLHTSGNPFVPVEHGRYIAEHIPNAEFVVHDSPDVLPYTESVFEAWMAEIQEFLTGERPAPTVDDRVLATVLFTDIVSSTPRVASMGDREWKALLTRHNQMIARQLDAFRGRLVHTSGDGLLATFDGPARAVRCACAIVDSMRALDLEVRAGVHTGEIELAGDDVAGITVHIGSRVQSLAAPGQVLVSRTVVDLVAGSGLEFEEYGEHELKGVPGRFTLFAVKA
jgi:class 3 adenylate cyclase